ncbi:MAG TPA: 3'(2'),5'-bisphosphate nucleotidase CysQ [Polyangiaceae bacterium]
MMEKSRLLQQLYSIAESAAKLVLEVYESDFGVELKGPNDPVTEADKRANQLICQRLADAFPGCPIVAEESDPSVFGDYQHAERVFFVDPVDGTREFVRRTGEFVVMIGCVEDTRATAGIIWAPTVDTVWLGETGVGAFRRRRSEDFVSIGPSLAAAPNDALMLVSRAQTQQEIETLQQQLRAARVEAMGSAGLKGAAVSDGSADAYVAPRYAGKRWDACAPDAIVSASGAVFTDCDGRAIDYRGNDLVNRRGLLAANACLHGHLVERLRA